MSGGNNQPLVNNGLANTDSFNTKIKTINFSEGMPTTLTPDQVVNTMLIFNNYEECSIVNLPSSDDLITYLGQQAKNGFMFKFITISNSENNYKLQYENNMDNCTTYNSCSPLISKFIVNNGEIEMYRR